MLKNDPLKAVGYPFEWLGVIAATKKKNSQLLGFEILINK